MKKIAIFLFSCLMSHIGWAQTHTLTIKAEPARGLTSVTVMDGQEIITSTSEYDEGSSRVFTYELIEGKTYDISLKANDASWLTGTFDYNFSAWMKDDAVYSTSSTLHLTMGKNDISLRAIFYMGANLPYSPGANSFDGGSGTMTLDELRNGSIYNAYYYSLYRNVLPNSYNYDDIRRIIIVGHLGNNQNSFHNLATSTIKGPVNAILIDMSQTSGMPVMQGNFCYNRPCLQQLILNADLESIEPDAFVKQYTAYPLNKIECYAIEPPQYEEEIFRGLPDGVTAYVPVESIDNYKQANGWKNLNIQPLYEASDIWVQLPADVPEGLYADMSVELKNLRSEYVRNKVISKKKEFLFNSLPQEGIYQVTIKNCYGQKFGQIDSIELGKENITVSFDKLLRPHNVDIKVLSPNGEDVTEQVKIEWMDESEKLLSQQTSIRKVPDGIHLFCKIMLNEALARQYATPAKMELVVGADSENTLTCQLQDLREVKLNGIVLDKHTGKPLSSATVSLSQQLGGRYGQAQTSTTDENGQYELSATNEAFQLAVSATGYLTQRIELDAPEQDTTLSDVELELIACPIINTWLTYTKTVEEGEAPVVEDGYEDYGMIAYQVYNHTKAAELQNVITQDNMLILPDGVEQGDSLVVTAQSRSDAFIPVVAGCVMPVTNVGYVTLPIVQLGGIEATVTSAQSKTAMGLLYDSNGQFVRSANYQSGRIKMMGVADGNYTLITMTINDMLRRVLFMSTLKDMGLSEGTDYVKNSVQVESGKITAVSVANIPVLDIERLQFTDPATTYIIADKTDVILGKHFNIIAKLEFKQELAGRIDNVKFVLDMPDELSMSENSAMSGLSLCSYSIEDNHYIFPLETGNLSLSVLPIKNGNYRATGTVSFTLDGNPMVQPIGSVWVQVKGLTIDVPEFTNSLRLFAFGTCPQKINGTRIVLYDYDEVIGESSMLTSGRWEAAVELKDLKWTNVHAIKARMLSADGKTDIYSDVKYVKYDSSISSPEKVEMLFMNAEVGMQYVAFDNIEKLAKPNFYYFIPKAAASYSTWGRNYSPKFTFMAHFAEKDTAIVKNPEFVILASDGTTRRLPAKYDGEKQDWYAVSNYDKSSKMPVSAYFNCDYNLLDSGLDLVARIEERAERLTGISQHVQNKTGEKCETTILTDEEDRLEFLTDIDGKATYKLSVAEVDFDKAVSNALENGPFLYKGDNGSQIYSVVNGKDSLNLVLIDINDKYALQTIVTDMNASHAAPSIKTNNNGPRRIKLPGKDRLKAWGTASSVGSGVLDALGLKGYLDAAAYHDKVLDDRMDMRNKMRKKERDLNNRLNGSCGVSIFDDKFNLAQKERFGNQIDDLVDRCEDFLNRLDDYREGIIDDVFRKAVWDTGINCLGIGLGKAAASAAGKAMNYIGNSADPKVAKSIANQIGFGYDLGVASLDDYLDFNFDKQMKDFDDYVKGMADELMNEWDRLEKEMGDAEKDCDEDDEEEDDEDEDNSDKDSDDEELDDSDYDFPSSYPSVSPIIDPSGYVYEAVPSNRLEGVTATLYNRVVQMTASGSWNGDRDVKWDAEMYGQENPLRTDERGMYRWDVPQGLWQVRLQKEGYENTQSEWLPVPPPQLDVNLAMVQQHLPQVENAKAYEDAVNVKFEKYMLPTLLNTENISIAENGKNVEGTIVLLDEEEAKEGITYASQLRFVPNTPFTANEVTLHIASQVQSYAGLEMEEDYEAVLPVEKEVKELLVDTVAKVSYGSFRVLHVKAEPAVAAAGKTLKVATASGIIASMRESSVVLNENGEVDVTVQGDLPGSDFVTYTLVDTDVKAQTLVKVIETKPYFVAVPEASVASETEVVKGTKITLSCETENAVIYYTLDGTCPCTSDSRILYDGTPIVINSETTIRVMAVVDGKGESEVATYHYLVLVDDGVISPSEKVKVTPVRVTDSFQVTGIEGRFNLTVYNMAGEQMVMRKHLRSGQLVDVASLTQGVYIVNIEVDGQAFNQRIIKIE